MVKLKGMFCFVFASLRCCPALQLCNTHTQMRKWFLLFVEVKKRVNLNDTKGLTVYMVLIIQEKNVRMRGALRLEEVYLN